MKKLCNRALSFALIITMIAAMTVYGYAADMVVVYLTGSRQITAGTENTFTIALRNNTGIAGFNLEWKVMDANGNDASSYFTHTGNWLTVSSGGVLKDEDNETIGALNRDGITINWNTAENVDGDGDVIDMKLSVSSAAYNGDYTLQLGLVYGNVTNFAGIRDNDVVAVPVTFEAFSFTVTGGQEKPSVADAAVALNGADSLTYDGTAKTPASVTVTKDGNTLTEGTDYDVTYKDASGNAIEQPIDAGTYTVVIRGRGDYGGTNETKTFVIARKELTLTGITVGEKTYDGTAEAAVSGGTLDGIADADSGKVTLGTITAAFADAYAGTGKSVTVTAAPISGDRAANYTVTLPTDLTGTIKAAAQTVTVKDSSAAYGGTVDLAALVSSSAPGATYTYEIDPISGGAAYATLSGSSLSIKRDSTAVGKTVSVTVNASAVDVNGDGVPEYEGAAATLDITIISKQTAVLTVSDSTAAYDGTEKSAEVTVTTPAECDRTKLTVNYSKDGQAVTGPTAAGTYTVTAVYEDDDYYGTASGTLTIQPAALSKDRFTVDTSDAAYTGQAITKSVTAKGGATGASGMTEGTDYTVTYDNNINVGSATITITGQGNYTGSLTYTFNITAKSLSKDDFNVGESDAVQPDGTVKVTYTGSEITVPVSAAAGASGPALTEGVDYRVAYKDTAGQTVSAPKNAGNYTLVVTGIGNYSGTLEYPVTAAPKELTLKNLTVTKVYDGTAEAEVTVGPDSLTGAAAGDDVSIGTITAAFEDANVGTDKEVVISEVTLTGAQAANYTVALPEGITGTIEKCRDTTLTLNNLSQTQGSVTKPGYTLNPQDEDASVTFWYASEVTEVGEAETITEDTLAADGLTEEEIAELTEKGTLVKTIERQDSDLFGNPITVTETITYTRTVTSGSGSGEGEEGDDGEEIVTYTKQTTTVTPSWIEWTEDNAPSEPGIYDILAVSSETDNLSSATQRAELTIVKKSSGSSGSGGGSGSAVTNRAITIESDENGTVTASRNQAAKGDQITLTVTPVEGKAVDTVTVTDSSGSTVAVSGGAVLAGRTEYTFTMPDSAVTVKVTYKDDSGNGNNGGEYSCDGGVNCPSHDYSDVDTARWYHEAVDYVIQNGLMTGTSGITFQPESTLTRVMTVQILYNYAGKPAASGAAGFTDVSASAWYADAVAWAEENGVVTGYSDTLFGPEDAVTREQLISILYRYSGSPETAGEAALRQFSDRSEVSDYAKAAMQWAASEGLVNGRTTSQLAPKATATRAEAAAMFMRWIRLTEGN